MSVTVGDTTETVDSRRWPAPIRGPGILLGLGLGGFVDGIVLHQVLQWHHLLSHAEPPTSLPTLRANVLADGLFHAMTWIFVAAGIAWLWARVHRGGWTWSRRVLLGWMLVGWGIFNLVEGVVDHHLLRIHRVRPEAANPLLWDLGFLAFGLLLTGLAGCCNDVKGAPSLPFERTRPRVFRLVLLPDSRMRVDTERIEDLLCQTLETEVSMVRVYQAAIGCAVDDDLRLEWQKHLDQTDEHAAIARQMLGALGVDPELESPGRDLVRFKADALINAMEMAARAGDRLAAQLAAVEAVVVAENKRHANWDVIGRIAEEAEGEWGPVLGDAYGHVQEEQGRHLYHSVGWARELWIDSLGMPAVLPPPEERKKVKTAIGASRAGGARGEMIDGNNAS